MAQLPRRALRPRRRPALRGGGADGFRDEDTGYALRLCQAGVPTELHVLPGAPHGVQMFPDSVLARRWNAIVVEWLGLQLVNR